jgi:ribosomal-protein-alanine N-acetyltransferase
VTVEWTIEPMNVDADLDGVLAIEAECFVNPWTRDMYLRELQHPSVARVFVLRMPGEPVAGFCSMWLVFDELHINNVAVRPAHRRRGAGTALLRHVLAEAARLGALRATLEVRASNQAARRLYERLGFREAGVRRNYYANPPEDALILWAERLDIA